MDYIQNSIAHLSPNPRPGACQPGHRRQAGYNQVRLVGDAISAEICRLTCLEQAITLSNEAGLPALEVRGVKVALMMEDVT